ncbi:MAG: CooT family nickel-binding protein [Lachnospiraceae bacterium]|nr:CooT family nickel-binding protein [Lachnospiraceae bacterium]
MCLSTVMLEKNGTSEKVCEYVSNVKTEGNKITLTDVLGTETEVFGTIKSMDFIKNLIVVEA